jgi:long-chain fatty acid transport protein
MVGGIPVRRFCWPLAVALAVLLPSLSPAQGAILPGVGAINAGFGGAGTAAPLDALGALYWNPGIIAAVPNRVDVSAEMLSNRNRVSSQVAADAFGPGFPSQNMAGTTNSDAGIAALPAVGVVYSPPDSPFTFGLGMLEVGGFFVNFPVSATNPIFTPPPLKGVGLGGVFTNFSVLQVVPTVAVNLIRGLSFGIAPVMDIVGLQLSADPFVAPNLNPDFTTSAPQAYQSRMHYGLGFQTGVYWQSDCGVNLGFSYKSPQWIEPIEFYSTDSQGQFRAIQNNLTYPMIFSWGMSYTGIERLVMAVDLRYIGYSWAEGFGGSPTFRSDGSLGGLGWQNVFALGTGVQYQLNQYWTLRAGYTYNQNPVPAADTFINVAAPAVFKDGLDLGATFRINQTISLSAAWVHGFTSAIAGPYLTAAGPVPGTAIQANQTIDAALFQLTVAF